MVVFEDGRSSSLQGRNSKNKGSLNESKKLTQKRSNAVRGPKGGKKDKSWLCCIGSGPHSGYDPTLASNTGSSSSGTSISAMTSSDMIWGSALGSSMKVEKLAKERQQKEEREL